MILSTYILALPHQMQGEGEESEATNHAMQTPHLMRTPARTRHSPQFGNQHFERSSLRKSVYFIAMSQRITLPSYLRLTKDSLWLSRPCPMQARRQFSAYQKLNAGARMTMREQQMPARPSMATAQKMNMKDMRKQDIPEEMGMVRSMLPSTMPYHLKTNTNGIT
jgi:hypothetical protein